MGKSYSDYWKSRIILIAVLNIFFVDSLEAVQCRSYGRQLGECVVVTRCPRLLAILLSSERTIQDLRMLQKLTCVTEISDLEKDPVVCCPLSEISDALLENNNSNLPSSPSPNSPNVNTNPNFSIRSTTTPRTTQRPIPQATKAQTSTLSPVNIKKFRLLPSLMECSVQFGSDRIIGGDTVSHGSLPYMARLGYKHKGTGKLEYYCGGSIINKRYILTAGHCTQGFDENFILSEVRLGEHDATTDVDCSQELGNICSIPEDFKVEKIITHPQHNTATKHNDIALIRLNQDVSFSSYFVRPICLPFLKEYGIDNQESVDTQIAKVAGWGRQMWNKTQGSSVLMQVNIPVVANARCQLLYRRRVTITPKQMCAGGVAGKDSCSGDSGGPLMSYVKIPNQFSKPFQFGIVSFGQIQCGGALPGVYTRVSEYLSWILENIEP